jgi:hypothetical protein
MESWLMDPTAFLSTLVSAQIILHHLQKFETEEQGTERENQSEVTQNKDCLQRYIYNKATTVG